MNEAREQNRREIVREDSASTTSIDLDPETVFDDRHAHVDVDENDGSIFFHPPQRHATDKKWYLVPANWLRVLIIVVLLSIIIACFSHPALALQLFEGFLVWVEQHPLDGAYLFVLVYVITNILLLPGAILSTGCGFIYAHMIGLWRGTFIATVIILIGCVIGSALSFFNGRYLLRKMILRCARKYPTFAMIDHAVKKHGFRVTFLFRLSPGTPYSFFNYFMGLTSVRFSDYMLGSIGMIPNVFAYCFVGGTVQHIYELSKLKPETNREILIITIIGIVIMFVAFVYITYIARKEIQELTAETQKELVKLKSMNDNNASNSYNNETTDKNKNKNKSHGKVEEDDESSDNTDSGGRLSMAETKNGNKAKSQPEQEYGSEEENVALTEAIDDSDDTISDNPI